MGSRYVGLLPAHAKAVVETALPRNFGRPHAAPSPIWAVEFVRVDSRSTRRLPIWRPGQLARHGSVLLAWMLLRALAQAITVVLLARGLGTEAYGKFVAIIAVAGFVTPLAGLGLSHMLLRNGARDPAHLPQYFQRAARIWHLTLGPCVALAIALAFWLLPAGLPKLAMLAAITAELTASALTELRARQHQAQHHISAYGAINAGLPLLRLLALGVLGLLAGQVTLSSTLWVYAAASLGYLLLLWPGLPISAKALNGSPTESMPLRSGLPFSMAALAMRLQSEFNKPVLAHAGYGLAGNYNVAQRAVDMASLPLQALQESLWPRLYAQPDPKHQLRRTGLAMLALALALGFALWLGAPLLPWIVGPGYGEAIGVVRLLAWLPALQVLRSLLNFHAIHIGCTSLIGWACAFGGLASVAGVLAFVPPLGMIGAVIASYTAEAAMIAYLLFAIKRIAR